MIDTNGRHPGTTEIARWFDSEHLPADLQVIAGSCEDLAGTMITLIPDHPELTTGLRKLLEAKDCFVRATIAARTK